MNASVRVLAALAAMTAAAGFAQAPANEPTKEEIARAYRSRLGGAAIFIPRIQWERRRIREIRGWRLHFRQIGEQRSPGLMSLKYEAAAKKNGQCAGYQITDTGPTSPNTQIPHVLVVDPNGVKPCR